MLVLTSQHSGARPVHRNHDGAGSSVAQLRRLVHAQPRRTATAVLLIDVTEAAAEERTAVGFAAADASDLDAPQAGASSLAVELRVEADGRLMLAVVGLELQAVGLSFEEAQGCAALLAQVEDAGDVALPDRGGVVLDLTGWEAWADEAGGLRREHTVSRDVSSEDLPGGVDSLLPGAQEDYLHAGAVTADDLEALAPQVPRRVRKDVEDADADLDADLVEWFDRGSRRPRLQVLGPVTAHAYGKPLTKQRAYTTELLAYLSLRRSTGATPGEVATALDLSPSKTRDHISTLRSWLGVNPRTGRLYLPHGDKAAMARTRGRSIYQVDSAVLVDAELFWGSSWRSRLWVVTMKATSATAGAM